MPKNDHAAQRLGTRGGLNDYKTSRISVVQGSHEVSTGTNEALPAHVVLVSIDYPFHRLFGRRTAQKQSGILALFELIPPIGVKAFSELVGVSPQVYDGTVPAGSPPANKADTSQSLSATLVRRHSRGNEQHTAEHVSESRT
jgi:hypothetical protein